MVLDVLVGPITELMMIMLAPIVRCIKHHRNLEEYMDDLTEKTEELLCRKEDIESRRRTELLLGKTLKKEVELWLTKTERVISDARTIEAEVRTVNYLGRSRMGKRVLKKLKEVGEVYLKGNFPDGLVLYADVLSEVPLPITKLAGETTAKRKMEEIWECLMSEDVRKIGIYGMGGSGKTTTMKHIYNRLLKSTDKFDKLIWITVSKDLNVLKLQHGIARKLGFSISDAEDEMKRAALLFQALERRKRYVLIFDDMWEDFDLVGIGIPQPTSTNGCKLVITTRSLEVCRRMDCTHIKMELLSKQEAWKLFLDEVGNHILLDPDIETTAKQVAEECACLPLAIVVVARSLKGATYSFEWSAALEELRSSVSRHDEMETQVIARLKFSYTRLKDDRLQKCFLYCALYPEDFKIEREELIEHLIAEGIIEELENRQVEYNRGHSMLTKLENACLLEGTVKNGKEKHVKMHDLIRDMAIQILTVSHRTMVKAGMQLQEISDENKWLGDLETVSLMANNIKEVHSFNSLNCSNLKSLWLCRNSFLKMIDDSFFVQLYGLKVLDLSYTRIEELPGSLYDLTNLTTLLLRECGLLKSMSAIGKLKSLRKLDLQESGLVEVPEGLEKLTNLRYINLNTQFLKSMPTGVIPKLSCLQVLILNPFVSYLAVEVEEVMSLKKLETLSCQFFTIRAFNKYSTHLEEYNSQSSRMVKYHLGLGMEDNRVPSDFCEKIVYLRKCKLGKEEEEPLVLPGDVEELVIKKCNDVRNLSEVSSLEHAEKLHSVKIIRCEGIESVLCLTSNTILEGLRTLTLEYLLNLRVLLSGEEHPPPAPTPTPTPAPAPSSAIRVGTFSQLKELNISGCAYIEYLFPPTLILHLQQLETIKVDNCMKLEEIITDEVNNNPVYDVQYTLPRLKSLILRDLRGLKRICCQQRIMICNSIQKIEISQCKELKRIPLSLPLHENGQPSPHPSLERIQIHPKEQWETLEWDHPNTKYVLQPFAYCLYRFEWKPLG